MIFRGSYVLFIFLLSIDLSGAVIAQESQQRPNILFAFADDWGRYASAHAGLDGEGTPNDAPFGGRKHVYEKSGRRFNPSSQTVTKRIGVRDDPLWKEHCEWVYESRPRTELYDWKADPHQTKNVPDDPQYSDTRDALERQLMDELVRTNDPRLIDNGRFFGTPPLSGPTEQ